MNVMIDVMTTVKNPAKGAAKFKGCVTYEILVN
jgi:hypothetical protein